jgi:hypothetical protein
VAIRAFNNLTVRPVPERIMVSEVIAENAPSVAVAFGAEFAARMAFVIAAHAIRFVVDFVVCHRWVSLFSANALK